MKTRNFSAGIVEGSSAEAPDWEDLIRDEVCDAASAAADSIIEAGVRATGGETAAELLGVIEDWTCPVLVPHPVLI